ncbi:MAG: hypothetical protein P8N76_17050 [Pirellulaceae bacterium]|nr:hypothetical protein [Pirellulaceae bacterium]
MQFEELEQQWKQLDNKFDQLLRIERRILEEVAKKPAQNRVARLAIWPSLDLVFCLLVALVFGGILGDHWQETSIAGPAFLVLAAAILLLISSIWQLVQLASINWSHTVKTIQCSLTSLRMMKIRQFKWIILLSPLVGFSAFLAGLQWVNHRQVDPLLPFEALDPIWVVTNYTFGLAFIPLGYLASRFAARRYQSRDWFRCLLDNVSGIHLQLTQQELQAWQDLAN